MATDTVSFGIGDEQVITVLQQARQRLAGADGEVTLDFSAVRRIDSRALAELETLADAAQNRSIRLALRGVNVDVYKVLKLVKLAPRFTFVN